jgi:hypothetical protein
LNFLLLFFFSWWIGIPSSITASNCKIIPFMFHSGKGSHPLVLKQSW